MSCKAKHHADYRRQRFFSLCSNPPNAWDTEPLSLLYLARHEEDKARHGQSLAACAARALLAPSEAQERAVGARPPHL